MPASAGTEGAAGAPPPVDLSRRYIAEFRDHSEAEFRELLRRAESVISESRSYPQFEPIEFVLHGPEARFFLRENYARYREIVDRAARLDAFGIVDIKICEGWMALRKVQPGDLPAFVETVPYGPALEEQLRREGYVYF